MEKRNLLTQILILIGFISIVSSCAVEQQYVDHDNCNRNGYDWEITVNGGNVTFAPINNDRNCTSHSVIKTSDGYKLISMHPLHEENQRHFENTVTMAPLCLTATQVDGPVSPVADIAAGVVLTYYVLYDGFDFIGDLIIDLGKATAKVVMKMADGTDKLIEMEIDRIKTITNADVKKDENKMFVLYYKPHLTISGNFYIGITSGFGSPMEVLARRDAKHHRNEDYGAAIEIHSRSGIVGRWTIRGGEEWLILALGGPMSEKCGNLRHSIGINNKKAYLYYLNYLNVEKKIPVEFGLDFQMVKFRGLHKRIDGDIILDAYSPKDMLEFELADKTVK